jgi:hypothetical protein
VLERNVNRGHHEALLSPIPSGGHRQGQHSLVPAPAIEGLGHLDLTPDMRRHRSGVCKLDDMRRIARFLAACALVLVAASSPVRGFAAAEEYEGRKFYGVFEGDWLFLFALIAGAACLWAAARLARSALNGAV